MADTSNEDKIEKLTDRLREMTADQRFTNEDRAKIARQIQELMPKKKPKKSRQKRTKRPGHPSYIIDIDTTGLNKGGIVKKYMGGGSVKKTPTTKRSIGPAGASTVKSKDDVGQTKGPAGMGKMITTKGWGASRKT